MLRFFGREAADFHKIVQAKDFYYDTTKLQSLGSNNKSQQ